MEEAVLWSMLLHHLQAIAHPLGPTESASSTRTRHAGWTPGAGQARHESALGPVDIGADCGGLNHEGVGDRHGVGGWRQRRH